MEKEIKIPPVASMILQELIAGIIHMKNDFIIGFYLTGSIPLNDFHPDKSDIDFLILCNELPDRVFRYQLEKVHSTIERKYKKTNLNGTYLTYESLHVHHLHTVKILSYHEGQLQNSEFGMAPVALYELKTVGITLLGISVQNLPVTIQTDELNNFLFENINSYWKSWLIKHSSFGIHRLLLILIPHLTEWVILGVARQLFTLKTGKITSKTGAGNYCLQYMPHKYNYIVQQAIKIRNDKTKHLLNIKSSYYIQISIKRSVETLDCAYFMLDLFNTLYKKMKENRR